MVTYTISKLYIFQFCLFRACETNNKERKRLVHCRVIYSSLANS